MEKIIRTYEVATGTLTNEQVERVRLRLQSGSAMQYGGTRVSVRRIGRGALTLVFTYGGPKVCQWDKSQIETQIGDISGSAVVVTEIPQNQKNLPRVPQHDCWANGYPPCYCEVCKKGPKSPKKNPKKETKTIKGLEKEIMGVLKKIKELKKVHCDLYAQWWALKEKEL